MDILLPNYDKIAVSSPSDYQICWHIFDLVYLLFIFLLRSFYELVHSLFDCSVFSLTEAERIKEWGISSSCHKTKTNGSQFHGLLEVKKGRKADASEGKLPQEEFELPIGSGDHNKFRFIIDRYVVTWIYWKIPSVGLANPDMTSCSSLNIIFWSRMAKRELCCLHSSNWYFPLPRVTMMMSLRIYSSW